MCSWELLFSLMRTVYQKPARPTKNGSQKLLETPRKDGKSIGQGV